MRNTDKTSLAAIENAAQVIQHGASAPLLAGSSAPGKPLLAGCGAPDGPLLAGCGAPDEPLLASCNAPARVQITAPLLASCTTDGIEQLRIRKGK